MSKLLNKTMKGLLGVAMTLLLVTGVVNAQDSVTVTWKVNTAFVPDTVTAGSSVSLRGENPYFGGYAIRLDKKNKLWNVKGGLLANQF